MKISQALGLAVENSVAFIGAGGKSGIMFSLANELTPPVILCTTTHLAAWQAGLVGQHHVILTPEDISRLDLKRTGRLLLTGPQVSHDRLGGLKPEMMKVLQTAVEQHGISLLIEADGAQQRNLKAPASHEPAVPEWVSHVVVVAGLSGLGQPLDESSVHRAQLFSLLTGLKESHHIRVEDLATLLTSTKGGLKGVPEGSQRSLYLNQAEGSILISKGARVARKVIQSYDRVLIGSFKRPTTDGPVLSVLTPTAGIILAAGGSQRLGQSKQLLTWGGTTFLRQVVVNALTAGISPLTVVTGADREAIEAAIERLPVKRVHNPNWEDGQSSSMIVGLGALPEQCDNVIFLLSDQPQVSPVLIRQLIERYAQKRAPITAPMVNGQRGNPALFGRETFDALRNVRGDMGGRTVFNQFKVDWLPWLDERTLLDVDELRDFHRLKRAFWDDL